MRTPRSLPRVVGVLVLGVLAMLALAVAAFRGPIVATAQALTVLTIQASWPASQTIFEHLERIAERVDKIHEGGGLELYQRFSKDVVKLNVIQGA